MKVEVLFKSHRFEEFDTSPQTASEPFRSKGTAVLMDWNLYLWIVNSKLNNFFKVILPVLNWCQVTERGMKSVIVKPIHIISKPQF